jgi:hypothetical protein
MGPIKAIPSNWTKWDKIDIQGPKTFEEILKDVKEKYAVHLSLITVEGSYGLIQFDTAPEKFKLTPDQRYKELAGKDYNTGSRFIEMEISGETLDGVDAVLPPLRYRRN